MGIDKASADILSKTTQILRSGSEADINRLRQYLSKFKLQRPENSEQNLHQLAQSRELLQNLKGLTSSKEAFEYLSSQNPSKTSLVLMSKEIGLPTVKSDKLEHLLRKIIHEVVEARLNSEAIRNPDPRSSQEKT